MKTLLKITILITTYLMLLFTTTSCFFDNLSGIKGSKHVISEEREISANFNTIKVQQGITVYLTQGNKTDIKVEADDNIIDLLITEVKNDALNIYFEKNVNKTKARNVYLTTSDIEKIKTSSGARVQTENTIQNSSLDLDASSGSSIKIIVNTNEIKSESSSGANIEILGNTTNFIASSSSGSIINADKLECVDAKTNVSSGAIINVNVSGILTANASSGGNISYEGNPTEIDKNTSSGGIVSNN
ncbi:DUF2807 domain-containing protein [Lutibacter sp. HS1-25]|uniref:head GIN domain-containing protein n=1 Tax=Lutibacter sp. HS1-25 TaxID=2485000 RepID=UPI001010701A|nr:head GIN domain-containing protein [Lutibacter sp. HS1-25]RXP58559.1 DUF2807 domain-containing protein [Lutibacter sp. HS1-25]